MAVVILRDLPMIHGVWSRELIRMLVQDAEPHHSLIVFPDIDLFHRTQASGGLYNLRRNGPLGGGRIMAVPMPTRYLVPDGAGAITSSYCTEEEFNLPGVREAIDEALDLLRNLLRQHSDIYRFVYYFGAPEQEDLPSFSMNNFVGRYVSRELERIIVEENILRGW